MIDRLAHLLATGFGAGHSPLAPGTAGSLVAIALFWPLARAGLELQLAAVAVLFFVGTAAADRVARTVGKKDPGLVVVDEIAGQWLTLAGLPFTPAIVVAGFLLFRVMDMAKPWPARDLERLPGGWGIMADDIAAGVLAHLSLRVLLLVWPLALT